VCATFCGWWVVMLMMEWQPEVNVISGVGVRSLRSERDEAVQSGRAGQKKDMGRNA
jgi:hypothetical protein